MTSRTDTDRLVEAAGASGAGPLVRSGALRSLLGVGRTRFYELIWEPGFPQPVHLGDGESDLVWFTHEIVDWLAARPRVAPPAERAAGTPGGRAVLASDGPDTDGPTPPTEGAPLRKAGPRRRRETDDGTAPAPLGPEDLRLVPARPGRRAS